MFMFEHHSSAVWGSLAGVRALWLSSIWPHDACTQTLMCKKTKACQTTQVAVRPQETATQTSPSSPLRISSPKIRDTTTSPRSTWLCKEFGYTVVSFSQCHQCDPKNEFFQVSTPFKGQGGLGLLSFKSLSAIRSGARSGWWTGGVMDIWWNLLGMLGLKCFGLVFWSPKPLVFFLCVGD